MRYSMYVKKEVKTPHQISCDYFVARARKNTRVATCRKIGRNPQVIRNNYSNYELKNLFQKVLDN